MRVTSRHPSALCKCLLSICPSIQQLAVDESCWLPPRPMGNRKGTESRQRQGVSRALESLHLLPHTCRPPEPAVPPGQAGSDGEAPVSHPTAPSSHQHYHPPPHRHPCPPLASSLPRTGHPLHCSPHGSSVGIALVVLRTSVLPGTLRACPALRALRSCFSVSLLCPGRPVRPDDAHPPCV